MNENNLTEDYYLGQVEAAYDAFRSDLPNANVPYGRAYRDYRDALSEWLRFCWLRDETGGAGA